MEARDYFSVHEQVETHNIANLKQDAKIEMKIKDLLLQQQTFPITTHSLLFEITHATGKHISGFLFQSVDKVN